MRENRLLSDREQLLRQLPGALEGDLRSQVSQFVTDTQTWTQQTGKTTAELTARTTVTIDGRRSNIGKKAVYYRRGLSAQRMLQHHLPRGAVRRELGYVVMV